MPIKGRTGSVLFDLAGSLRYVDGTIARTWGTQFPFLLFLYSGSLLMNGRTVIVASILMVCTIAIATVTAQVPAPAASPVATLPTGAVFIASDGGQETTLENIELRTHGDVTFVVGHESTVSPNNKFGNARTWIRLNTVQAMVEVPKK
ncbi:MAG: hypothetical protein C0483_12965 [Pirellula sp.]|nr:hypothetical protein [Pirellula sp.]